MSEPTENEIILQEFIAKLLSDMVPLEPEYSKVVDDNFWELI